MAIQVWYWVTMLVWALFGGAVQGGYVGPDRTWVGSLLLFILFVILGVAVFGGPIK